MANFSQHLFYGMTTSAICSTVAYFQLGLTPVQSGTAMILGSIASLGPDVDHSEGLPAKIFFETLGILFPIVGISHIPTDYTKNFALEHWILYFFLSYIFIRIFLYAIFDKLTAHRGIFHSIPAAFLCGQAVFYLFTHLHWKQRLVMGGITSIGYLAHLVADEIYSVDWQGKKIKNSFGTAMDFGNFKEFSTWVVYSLISILAYLIFQDLSH